MWDSIEFLLIFSLCSNWLHLQSSLQCFYSSDKESSVLLSLVCSLFAMKVTINKQKATFDPTDCLNNVGMILILLFYGPWLWMRRETRTPFCSFVLSFLFLLLQLFCYNSILNIHNIINAANFLGITLSHSQNIAEWLWSFWSFYFRFGHLIRVIRDFSSSVKTLS